MSERLDSTTPHTSVCRPFLNCRVESSSISLTEWCCLLHLRCVLFVLLSVICIATQCYGNDPSQFPSSNLFGAAGEGIWDNGAACGRQYQVRCISASEANTCIPNQMIQIRIVDYAPASVSRPTVDGSTLVLSNTAFGSIANSSAASVNVEFRQ